MDKVEVNDEIEKRDLAIDQEDAGGAIVGLRGGGWVRCGRVQYGRLRSALFESGEDEEQAAEGEEAE